MQTLSFGGRNLAIDILRSLGIVCMIAGHVGFGKPFDHFIHAFHMPLFFFVSGLFFTDGRSFKTFSFGKAQKILLPYFSFALLYYVIWLLVADSSQPWYLPLKHLLWDNSVGIRGGMPFVGALWFLTAFFVANVVYFGINTIRNVYLQLSMIILVVLLGTLCPLMLPVRLPFTLDSGLVGSGFIYCGHKFKMSPYYEKLCNFSLPVLIFFSFLVVCLIFTNEYVNMRTGQYGRVFLFWFNALSSIIVGINWCKRLVKYAEIHKYFSKVIQWLAVIGKDSLIFLCVNEFVILILHHLIFLPSKFLSHLLCFTTTVIMCYLINLLFQHTFLRFFIGKFDFSKVVSNTSL